MKKFAVLLMILFVSFITEGCVFQDLTEKIQQKIEEKNMNEIEKILTNAYEKSYSMEDFSTENEQYKIDRNEYNLITHFKDSGTNADTYAFRVQTKLKVFNDTEFDVYEIGRIMINPKNIKKSKCCYNYAINSIGIEGRATDDYKWVNCSDKSFLESISRISKLKKEKYEKYEKLYLKTKNEFGNCSKFDSFSEAQKKCMNAYEEVNKQRANIYKINLEE